MFYAAVTKLGDFLSLWAELQPKGTYFRRIRLGIALWGYREQKPGTTVGPLLDPTKLGGSARGVIPGLDQLGPEWPPTFTG